MVLSPTVHNRQRQSLFDFNFNCSLSREPLLISASIDTYGLGLVASGFLHPKCNPDMRVLPDEDDALKLVFHNPEEMKRLLPCSLKLSYKAPVELACR